MERIREAARKTEVEKAEKKNGGKRRERYRKGGDNEGRM